MFVRLILALAHLLPALPSEPILSFDDLHAFPPRPVCRYMLDASRAAHDAIRMRESVEPWRAAHWWDARVEVARATQAWDMLLDARDEGNGERWRLDKLRCLRQHLGYRAYFAGEMPTPYPYRYFPQVD